MLHAASSGIKCFLELMKTAEWSPFSSTSNPLNTHTHTHARTHADADTRRGRHRHALCKIEATASNTVADEDSHRKGNAAIQGQNLGAHPGVASAAPLWNPEDTRRQRSVRGRCAVSPLCSTPSQKKETCMCTNHLLLLHQALVSCAAPQKMRTALSCSQGWGFVWLGCVGVWVGVGLGGGGGGVVKALHVSYVPPRKWDLARLIPVCFSVRWIGSMNHCQLNVWNTSTTNNGRQIHS